MYVATHLVRRGNREGINAFLHEHPEDFEWPEAAAAVAALADENPGTITHSRTDIEPGGNPVRAYLDMLAPNGTSRNELAEAVEALRRDLDERRNPTIFIHGKVTIRFGVELGLEQLREEQLSILAARGLALRERAPSPPRF